MSGLKEQENLRPLDPDFKQVFEKLIYASDQDVRDYFLKPPKPRSIEEFLVLQEQLDRFLCRKFTRNQITAERLIAIVSGLFVLPPYLGPYTYHAPRRKDLPDTTCPIFANSRRRAQRKAVVCETTQDVRNEVERQTKLENAWEFYGEDIPRAVGYIGGKYRVGVTSEQRMATAGAEKVMYVLGGILVVSVEATMDRTQQRALRLSERVDAVRNTSGVDIVLIDHGPNNGEDFPSHYKNVGRQIGVNFHFKGEGDHPIMVKLAQEAQELGQILLWDHPIATVHSSDLISELCGSQN